MIEPADLEIHEVTTDASLSTSLTTESITPINPEKKTKKLRAPVPNREFKSGWTDSPHET
jgi:hypothetical protein